MITVLLNEAAARVVVRALRRDARVIGDLLNPRGHAQALLGVALDIEAAALAAGCDCRQADGCCQPAAEVPEKVLDHRTKGSGA